MDKIYIAKLGKTVGLKGMLKLHIDSDFPEQFKKDVTLTSNKNESLKIELINLKNNTVKFYGFNDIDTAKRLINTQLYTSAEQTYKNCKLKENQYFWFDLIDCKIIENEKFLGIIKDIHRYPIDDYFEIITNKELLNEDFKVKTFLLPYNDNYIIDVNLEKKTINVKGAEDILLQS